MHRFYLPPEQCQESSLFLTGREAHHAMRVLRLGAGDVVAVFDGAGHEFLCQIGPHDRDKVRLELIEKRELPPLPCQITLIQALPKGKLFEAIIQKATELGVFRLVPLISERVVVHLDSKDAESKAAKWQQVAVEALKQCGAPWLPKVEAPVTLEGFLSRKTDTFELPLLGSLQPEARHPRTYIESFTAKHGRLPKSAAIWIGPEGDFTPDEIQAIQASGALPITLGRLVLRTETAAIFCLSFLNYELQAGMNRET
jgi:16S rRNA (uracil1498-N3)-methyltransferase